MRWLILVVLVACGPVPPPPPFPPLDDYPEASATEVCSNLHALGCSEGGVPNCIDVVLKVQSTKLTNLHTGCLAKATTKEAARACGSVRCADGR